MLSYLHLSFRSQSISSVSKKMSRQGWVAKFAALRLFLSGCETYLIAPTAWIYIKSLGQTTFFLALVLSAYNVSCIIAGPVSGFLTDRFGNPRLVFLCSCATKVFAYIIYSVNLSAYFPLFGRLLSGVGEIGVTVVLGQIALQPERESRSGNFVLLDSAYCVGAAFGPGIGSFIAFRTDILGWEINEGNSPGIVLIIIWLLFLIFAMLLPKDIWTATGAGNTEHNSTLSEDEAQKRLPNECGRKRKLLDSNSEWKPNYALLDSRLFCLIFLVFSSEVFSSTSTFYVPVLALDHFHLELIHIKLLFLNCTLFTLMIFVCIYLASNHVEDRKLVVAALSMQIPAITFLVYLAFSWDQVTAIQWYILLLYICFGMPYFAFPLANSMLSKMTPPQNATFVQGLSFGTLHGAIVISRVVVSFVFTKTSLLWYSFAMVMLWLVGMIWYAKHYKRMVPYD